MQGIAFTRFQKIKTTLSFMSIASLIKGLHSAFSGNVECVCRVFFSTKHPVFVRIGDILIAYGVGSCKMIGAYKMMSAHKPLLQHKVAWNLDNIFALIIF